MIAAVILLICYVGSFYTYFLDSVIAAVKPKPPPRHLRDDTCIDDDDLDLVIKLLISLKFRCCFKIQTFLIWFFFFFAPCFLNVKKFKLPRSTSRWKRKLFFFLRNKLKLPGKRCQRRASRPGCFSAMVIYYILKCWLPLRLMLFDRDTSDGDFLTQSKDLGNYHFMVCLCTYCPQMGSWTFICKSLHWFQSSTNA